MELTREEFINRSKSAQRLLTWATLVWLAWFIGAACAVSLLLPPEYRDKPVLDDWRLGLGAFAHFATSLSLLLWGTNVLSRRYGVACPNCGKPVTGSQVVIASGNCGFCGSVVIRVARARDQQEGSSCR